MPHGFLPILHFAISFIITFFALKVTIPIFKRLIPAKPTIRGMHKQVKPSSGGILFVIVYSILALYQQYYLALFSIPLAIIGLLDDKLNLSKLLRYAAQIITLITVLIFLNSQGMGFFFQNQNPYILTLILFFGSAIINFINFMDGIDGLVCGTLIVIFAGFNTQFHFLSPLIGALTAFLYFNWSPSKIFMGDSGSLFLGSFLVSLLYSSENTINLSKNILLCSPLILDAFICIARRFLNKENIFESHKLHLYQRLVTKGFSHSKVSLIYLLSVTFLTFLSTFLEIKYLYLGVLLVLLLGFIIDHKYAAKFND